MSIRTGKTRKGYAAEQGWCNAGRGRMSKEVLAKIAALEDEGYVFTDTVKLTTKVDASGKETVTKVEVNPFADIPHPIHNNKKWKVLVDGKEKDITEATVCMDCGVSLPWQICRNPRVITKWGELEAYYDYPPF